jgi:hypothetical protein
MLGEVGDDLFKVTTRHTLAKGEGAGGYIYLGNATHGGAQGNIDKRRPFLGSNAQFHLAPTVPVNRFKAHVVRQPPGQTKAASSK